MSKSRFLRRFSQHLSPSFSPLLFGSIVVAAMAACGSPGGQPPATPSPEGVSVSDAGVLGAPVALDGAVTPDQTGVVPATGPSTASSVGSKMKAPIATQMIAELQAIGLDPAKLPPLSKLEGDKLRKVMKLFTRSLGVKCVGCHTDDFAAPTPHKNVAEKMWDEYARGLTMPDGRPVFCDSCHQGADEFLDKSDKKALGKWMDENYASMKRRDGKEEECSSCHGDPFDGDFLDQWEKKARPAGNAATRNKAR